MSRIPFAALSMTLALTLCGCEEGTFEEADARALLPAASAADVPAWSVAKELGSQLTPGGVADAPSLPLLAMVVARAQWPVGANRDVRILDTKAFAEVVGGAGGPALLLPQVLDRVTATQDGNRAHGDVWFRAPRAYEGRVRYGAARVDGRWSITTFEFPWSGARIERRGDAWKLVRFPGWSPGVPTRFPGWSTEVSTAPRVDLPVVSEAEAAPEAAGSIPLVIHPRDGVWVDGVSCRSFAALSEAFVAATHSRNREPDGTSRADLVVIADAETPWAVVQWALQSGAGPRSKLYRLRFAVQHRASKTDGVISAFLPKDRGHTPTPQFVEERASVKVALFRRDQGTATPPEAVYRELLRIRSQTGAVPRVTIAAPPPNGPRVPYGFVVQVLDAVRRAGVTEVQFEGSVMPVGRGASTAEDLAEAMRGIAAQPAGIPIVKVNGKELVATDPPPEPIPDGAAPTAPDEPAPFRYEIGEARPAGPAVHAEPPPPAVAADPPFHEEMPTEEPVVEDVPVPDADMPFEEVPADEELSDAPFEGPGNNGTVGIGGGAGGAFKGRGRDKRGEHTKDAEVERALVWLAAHQAADGRWDAAKFLETCRGVAAGPTERSDGAGSTRRNVGATGLALSAFLGAGYSNRGSHPYAKTVSTGLRWLKNVQDPEGCYGPREDSQYLFDHAVSTFAMVQAYGLTESPIFKGSAQKAVAFALQARGPEGSWRYDPASDGDLGLTGWMLCVLEAARLVNANAASRGGPPPFEIDAALLEGTRSWIESRVREAGEASVAATALDLLARALLVKDPADPKTREVAVRLGNMLPQWEAREKSVDTSTWLFGSLATARLGGDGWTRWKASLVAAVRATQRSDGTECTFAGSWDPYGPWAVVGGRVYATALAALCLEVPGLLPRPQTRR